MASVSLGLLLVSILGCMLTAINTNIADRIGRLVILELIVLPVPIYWHWRRQLDFRDSSQVILWTLLITAILPFPILTAARLHMPLRDSFFASLDAALGLNVPSLMAWARQHHYAHTLEVSYDLLKPLLLFAALGPALAGKLKSAREFLTANVLAFLVVIPLFAVLPGVGPWHYYHLTPTSAQLLCQSEIVTLRLPAVYSYNWQEARIICFPSFHVIWAILSTRALWVFRSVRIPLAVLAIMIVVSTMTTGWHYFSDVLSGLVVAAIAVLGANKLAASQRNPHPQTVR
ncbi:MAG: phosphatase PAP2 family protein [Candidatus Korobacteraceae bacterium]